MVAVPKKQKVDSECRRFQTQWYNERSNGPLIMIGEWNGIVGQSGGQAVKLHGIIHTELLCTTSRMLAFKREKVTALLN